MLAIYFLPVLRVVQKFSVYLRAVCIDERAEIEEIEEAAVVVEPHTVERYRIFSWLSW